MRDNRAIINREEMKQSISGIDFRRNIRRHVLMDKSKR
jgi:hypothetical protein